MVDGAAGGWRWQFRRYDERRAGVSGSRGWLHFLGWEGRLSLVVGFHCGVRATGHRGAPRPWAWVELTLYAGRRMFSIYPGVRVPSSWL